eukprot:m.10758 g.10758  ORF g.10758 m.10758 type:complete len:593 (-) comp3722_c0_seq2:87-1865(-)
MDGGEIITLQLGNFSNFVGSHFWNAQEAWFEYSSQAEGDGQEGALKQTSSQAPHVDHKHLFRVGETPHGILSYTPRVLVFDLNGSVRGLKQEGDLYGELELPTTIDSSSWDINRVQVIHHQKDVQSNYMAHLADIDQKIQSQLDQRKQPYVDDSFVVSSEDMSFWNYYMRTYLHPRSLNIIKAFNHHDPIKPFDAFWKGKDLISPSNKTISCKDLPLFDVLEDGIRWYMEECNSSQGFQVFADADTGFSGICAGVLEHLHDEYGRKGILCFGLHSPEISLGYDPDQEISSQELIASHLDMEEDERLTSLTQKKKQHQNNRLRSAAYLHYECKNNSAVYVPLSTHDAFKSGSPHKYRFEMNSQNLYEVAATMSAAIDTVTLPMRLSNADFSFGHLISSLNSQIQMAGLSMLLPFPNTGPNKYLSDVFAALESKEKGVSMVPLTPHLINTKVPMFASLCLRGFGDEPITPPYEVMQARQRASKYDKCVDVDEMLQTYVAETRIADKFWAKSSLLPLAAGVPFPMFFNEHGLSGRKVSVPVMTSLETGDNVWVVAKALIDEFTSMRHKHVMSEYFDDEELQHMIQQMQDMVSCDS